MHIRHTNQQCDKHPSSPGTSLSGKNLQRNEENQRPELSTDTQHKAHLEALGNPRPEQQVQNENHIGRDTEQVGVEGAEAQGFQLQTYVRRCRDSGDHPCQAEDVDNPHVVVLQCFPEEFWCDRLAIVHAAFAGVVAENAVNHDLLLALIEPPLFTPEQACCLCWRGWHPEGGDDTDHAGDQAFKGEQVPPATFAVRVVDVQEAEGEEGADD